MVHPHPWIRRPRAGVQATRGVSSEPTTPRGDWRKDRWPCCRSCTPARTSSISRAAQGPARRALLERAALERVVPLGHVIPGVLAPAALVVARREDDAARREGSMVQTPHGPIAQAALQGGQSWTFGARLAPAGRALV